jgi:hypothetical protein
MAIKVAALLLVAAVAGCTGSGGGQPADRALSTR